MAEEEPKAIFRVVAIGDSSVGKTSIINRFLRDTFDLEEPNTIGAMYDSFTRTCNGKQVEIQLWDTAGQEQYRALGPVYFRSAAAALIVFDVTNEQSFSRLIDWLTSFRDVTGDSTVSIIVGNKCDLPVRAVSTVEAKTWARNHGSAYIETSARTGQGIPLLFDELVSSILAVNTPATEVKESVMINSGGQKKAKSEGCC
jgi:small GTP-binding protein